MKPAPPVSKTCTGCGLEKLLDDFRKEARRPHGYSARCKECARADSRRSYADNHESNLAVKRRNREKYGPQLATTQKDYRVTNKMIVMTHYCGGTPYCVGCGITNMEVLTIDHINEDGAEHRKEVRHSQLPAWLIRNGFPDNYQILCWNCNNAKHRRGAVPVYTFKEGFVPSVQYPKE